MPIQALENLRLLAAQVITFEDPHDVHIDLINLNRLLIQDTLTPSEAAKALSYLETFQRFYVQDESYRSVRVEILEDAHKKLEAIAQGKIGPSLFQTMAVRIHLRPPRFGNGWTQGDPAEIADRLARDEEDSEVLANPQTLDVFLAIEDLVERERRAAQGGRELPDFFPAIPGGISWARFYEVLSFVFIREQFSHPDIAVSPDGIIGQIVANARSEAIDEPPSYELPSEMTWQKLGTAMFLLSLHLHNMRQVADGSNSPPEEETGKASVAPQTAIIDSGTGVFHIGSRSKRAPLPVTKEMVNSIAMMMKIALRTWFATPPTARRWAGEGEALPHLVVYIDPLLKDIASLFRSEEWRLRFFAERKITMPEGIPWEHIAAYIGAVGIIVESRKPGERVPVDKSETMGDDQIITTHEVYDAMVQLGEQDPKYAVYRDAFRLIYLAYRASDPEKGHETQKRFLRSVLLVAFSDADAVWEIAESVGISRIDVLIADNPDGTWLGITEQMDDRAIPLRRLVDAALGRLPGEPTLTALQLVMPKVETPPPEMPHHTNLAELLAELFTDTHQREESQFAELAGELGVSANRLDYGGTPREVWHRFVDSGLQSFGIQRNRLINAALARHPGNTQLRGHLLPFEIRRIPREEGRRPKAGATENRPVASTKPAGENIFPFKIIRVDGDADTEVVADHGADAGEATIPAIPANLAGLTTNQRQLLAARVLLRQLLEDRSGDQLGLNAEQAERIDGLLGAPELLSPDDAGVAWRAVIQVQRNFAGREDSQIRWAVLERTRHYLMERVAYQINYFTPENIRLTFRDGDSTRRIFVDPTLQALLAVAENNVEMGEVGEPGQSITWRQFLEGLKAAILRVAGDVESGVEKPVIGLSDIIGIVDLYVGAIDYRAGVPDGEWPDDAVWSPPAPALTSDISWKDLHAALTFVQNSQGGPSNPATPGSGGPDQPLFVAPGRTVVSRLWRVIRGDHAAHLAGRARLVTGGKPVRSTKVTQSQPANELSAQQKREVLARALILARDLKLTTTLANLTVNGERLVGDFNPKADELSLRMALIRLGLNPDRVFSRLLSPREPTEADRLALVLVLSQAGRSREGFAWIEARIAKTPALFQPGVHVTGPASVARPAAGVPAFIGR